MNSICDASREDVNFNARHIFVSLSSLIGDALGRRLGKLMPWFVKAYDLADAGWAIDSAQPNFNFTDIIVFF